MPVRIAVSDPLPMFGRGVAEAMRGAGYDVESPDDLLSWTNEVGPHMVMLTLLSPADWTLLATLHESRSQAALIAVIEHGDVLTSVRALVAGAVAVVAREANPETVYSVVSAVAAGRSLLPVEVVRALTTPQHRPPAAEHIPTDREIAWVRMLAQGFTVARLAQHAGYSERMMFRLLRALYGRWGVANRTEAIVHARGNEWL
jgi:DNA-binding NarL/FixJ family response regulator